MNTLVNMPRRHLIIVGVFVVLFLIGAAFGPTVAAYWNQPDCRPEIASVLYPEECG